MSKISFRRQQNKLSNQKRFLNISENCTHMKFINNLIISLLFLNIASASSSPFASGTWLKVGIEEDGVYKITYSDLVENGLTPNGKHVRIFCGNPTELPERLNENFQYHILEIATYQNYGSDGIFNENDYILFYAEDSRLSYYDSTKNFIKEQSHSTATDNYYFITVSSTAGKTIQASDRTSIQGNEVRNYIETLFFEENNVKLKDFHSGRQWFQLFNSNEQEYEFSFSNIVNKSTLKIFTRYLSRSDDGATIKTYINNSQIDSQSFSSSAAGSHDDNASVERSFAEYEVNTNTFNLRYQYLAYATNSYALMDYVIVNATCNLNYNSDQIIFSGEGVHENNNSFTFSLENSTNLNIWDITNYLDPQNVIPSISDRIRFQTPSKKNKYIAFKESDVLYPDFKELITNQDILAIKDVDMIIISSYNFMGEAERLANLHRELDNMKVSVVNQYEIFNEFSSGKVDVSAIRNFLKYVYDNSANVKLGYVLLFGDGTYANNKITKEDNYIVTWQTQQSVNGTHSFVCDDYFGMIGDDEGVNNDYFYGDIDLGVGRITASTTEEAVIAVNKIYSYCKSPESRGNWKNNIIFFADDSDGDESESGSQLYHAGDSDSLAKKVSLFHPEFNIKKYYSDAYKQHSSSGNERYPDVELALENAIEQGALIFNYKGHGGPKQMMHEKVVSRSSINEWHNPNKLPLFITASCEIAPYDNPNEFSLGEKLYLKEDGGAIALFTTTRVVYSGSNQRLSLKLFDYLLKKDEDGKGHRLGDIVKLAKNATTGDTFQNKRSFTLIGDPALRIPLPQYTIRTDSLNGVNIEQDIDTLYSLAYVRVSGHIENLYGEIDSTYNGTVYPAIFDKKYLLKSLGNDGYDPIEFETQNNILYKGKASVKDGFFSFSFYLPKDISFQEGFGKINYYADNGEVDAMGYQDSLLIGYNPNIYIDDIEGPTIQIYMNDTTFSENDKTNENPILFVKIFDETGINVTGSAIGHDATAYIDENYTEIIVLNDFFEADLNTYQSGQIRYQLNNLEEGWHTLTVKIWDVNNNSTESTLRFYVSNSDNIVLENLMNYPNPFSDNTTIQFSHNQTGEEIEVVLKVYDSNGRLIKELKESYYSETYINMPIEFGELETFKLKSGVYVYTITLKNNFGEEKTISSNMLYIKE